MNLKVTPAKVGGTLRAIASKSYMHRALICASLADKPTVLSCPESNRDIAATIDCMRELGARITEDNGKYTVFPIDRSYSGHATLPCNESGSTLRFLLPVTAALGRSAVFLARGRLSARPLSPLYEQLVSHGVTISPNGVFPLSLCGQLQSGDYSLDGSVSSQFFTGLLLALPTLGDHSSILVEGVLESAPYVRLTESVLNRFGVFPIITETRMEIAPSVYRSPERLEIEGDWSNAAFWLVAGAIGGELTVTGLQFDSCQGDKAIVSLLKQMGADITVGSDRATVKRSALRGIEIDAQHIPDLVPILSVAAAYAQGETVIRGASRLRLKESDRISSVLQMLGALGIVCTETNDGMIIKGGMPIGGTVDACNDHRIAMSAAVAALACKGDVTILGAEAVNKSYPTFFDHLTTLGGHAVQV